MLYWYNPENPLNITELQVFLVWISIKYPDIVKSEKFKEIVNPIPSNVGADDYDFMLGTIDECYKNASD